MQVRQRIIAIDLLRGFAIAAMILVNNPGTWEAIYSPLKHASWHGFTPTDLVFPLFIFIVGMSIAYAYKDKTLNGKAFRKIFLRSLKLFALGVFLNYFPFFNKDIETLRVLGVLQRIAITFFISSLLFLSFRWKMLLYIIFVLLLGYWLWLSFVPIHGVLPTLDRGSNNWVLYIDQMILGEHMWRTDYDPEGLLSTLPCIASCLIGILAGKVLQTHHSKRLHFLIGLGVVCLLLGLLWSCFLPINKALWTSSFVVFTSGWAFLLLAMCYYITDIRKIVVGKIFLYMGNNAIGIYMLSGVFTILFYTIPLQGVSLHHFLYEKVENIVQCAKMSSLVYALVVTSFYLTVAYIMHKKRWYINV